MSRDFEFEQRVLDGTGEAAKFLKAFHPKGPWVLTEIPVDKQRTFTATFYPDTFNDMLTWIADRNGKTNLYFMVNTPGGKLESKAAKEDVHTIHYLHVDVDPRAGEDIAEEQERALHLLTDKRPEWLPQPTFVTFSGGGYQAFWKLIEPIEVKGNIERIEDFECYNRGIEHKLGGDHCHNADRIMRLPGTLNIPNKKKKAKGRVPTWATLTEHNAAAVVELTQFKPTMPLKKQEDSRSTSNDRTVKISGNVPRLNDLAELDEWKVPDRIKVIIAQGHLRDIEGPKTGDDSRSGWLFDCVCGLKRAGVPDDLIYGIITDPQWHVSESVRDKGRMMDRYAKRQIAQAGEDAIDPRLKFMNDQFAIIESPKCKVAEEWDERYETDSGTICRSVLVRQSFEDFRNRHMNQKVVIKMPDGKDKITTLGEWWLNHPQRRTYHHIDFTPGREQDGVYNLWKGFAVEPRKGNCSLYLEHIRKNICNGNDELYTYVVNWMARAVQFPGYTGQTALVLRGGQGTGKGVFAKNFLALFGRHGMQVTNVRHFLGNFNAHLRDCVMLFADEAFFAGDKSHESLLKTLVTEETMQIEAKGIDVEVGPNYVHLIMASNSDWVIPAGPAERRFVVCDVADSQQQNETYFAALQAEMNNGGREALLDMLLEHDISAFSVRKFPRTEALAGQRTFTLDPIEEWWMSRLTEGCQTRRSGEWEKFVAIDALEADFVEYARNFNIARRGNRTRLGMFMSKITPDLTIERRRVKIEYTSEHGFAESKSVVKRGYVFPELNACREFFNKTIGASNWRLDEAELDLQKTAPQVPLEEAF